MRYCCRWRIVALFTFVFRFALRPISAAEILAIFPFHAKSHYAVVDLLLVQLAKRGHTVTVYSPYPKSEKIANYIDIDVSDCFRFPESQLTPELMQKYTDTFEGLHVLYESSPTFEKLTNCRPLMELFESGGGKRYDLLITQCFHTDLFLIYAYKLKVPFITVSPNILFPWLSSRLGVPDNPAYMPQFYVGYTFLMSFPQRIRNLYNYLLSAAVFEFLIGPKDDDIARRLLGPGAPSLSEFAAKNTSLMMVNSNYVVNGVRPTVPNLIEISGINVKAKVSPLPRDIEKFINGSEHGVIYFCMGSLLRGSSFPEDKRKAFLYAFSKIPQRVLWKWEGDNLPGKPDNVMIAKWMPQRDILAHPNVKLFISHGGLLGTNEAVYEGVPILGIPIFGDQRTNVKSIEASGAGELLDYNDISDEVVFGKIQKLLHDPKYRENAKELSRRYRDRPMSPLDTAVYWTEYVIRHKGAHHLRSAAVDLPWYQYLLLDVIAFVLLVLVVSLLSVYYSIKFTLRFIFRKLFGKKQPTKSEKSKKKLN